MTRTPFNFRFDCAEKLHCDTEGLLDAFRHLLTSDEIQVFKLFVFKITTRGKLNLSAEGAKN